MEFLLEHRVDPSLEVRIPYFTSRVDRQHPINGLPFCQSATPFLEAIRVRDFSACRALFRSSSQPFLIATLRHLTTDMGKPMGLSVSSWPHGLKQDEESRSVYEEQLDFLLDMDEEQTIRAAPQTFPDLVAKSALPPCSLLLHATLDKEAIIQKLEADYSTSLDAGGLGTATWAKDLPDSAFRLAVAIVMRNWNAAHFLFQNCNDTSWTHEKGLEYFRPVLAALQHAPQPGTIGQMMYQTLLGRWNMREDRPEDVCTALFHEACGGPLDPAPFLISGNIDINATDREGNTVLHRLFAWVKSETSSRHEDTPWHLLHLLRSGADPRVVNKAGISVLHEFEGMKRGGRGPLRGLRVLSFRQSGRHKTTVRMKLSFSGVEETFSFT